jgi:hypothetical protein
MQVNLQQALGSRRSHVPPLGVQHVWPWQTCPLPQTAQASLPEPQAVVDTPPAQNPPLSA